VEFEPNVQSTAHDIIIIEISLEYRVLLSLILLAKDHITCILHAFFLVNIFTLINTMMCLMVLSFR